MITTLRKWLKGKGAQYFMLFMVIVIAVIWMLPSRFGRSDSRKAGVVATVNDTPIVDADYKRKVEAQKEYVRLFRQQYGQYADTLLRMIGMQSDPYVAARELAIKNVLLDQVALQMGLVVHPDFLNLSDMRSFQHEATDIIPYHVIDASGMINPQQLALYLQRANITQDEFYAQLENAVRRTLLQHMVGLVSYVPNFAIKEQFVSEYVGKKFSLMKFAYEDFLRIEEKKGCTPEEVKAFFEQNKQRYRIPEKRSGIVWTFTPQNYGVVIGDADVEDYYQDNKERYFVDKPIQMHVRHILIKDEAKAHEVYAQVKEHPENFADKAREVSEDKESASKGGDLPTFSKGTHEKEFELAVLKLTDDKDISPVVPTEKGFEIIQRISRTDKTFKPLAMVKDQVHEKLLLAKFREHFDQDMSAYAQVPSINEAKFEAVVEAKKAKREESAPQVKNDTRLMQALFRLAKGEYDIFTDNNNGYVVRLTTIQESYIPELAAIQKTVEHDVYEMRAEKAVKRAVDQARLAAKTEDFAAVGKKLNGSIETTGFLKLEDKKAQELAKKNQWPLEQMFQIEKVGMLATVITDRSGYVVCLDALEQWTEAVLNAKRTEIVEKLARQDVGAAVRGFIASLQRNATIKEQESFSRTRTENEPEEEDNTI